MSSVIFSTAVSHHCPKRLREMLGLVRSHRRRLGCVCVEAALARVEPEARLGVVPHLSEEAMAALHVAVAPVERALRACRVKQRQTDRVGAILVYELVGVDDVAEVLAHLAPIPYYHLVKQAAREGLAVAQELERPDVSQGLGDRALVEHEIAAVRAGHHPLRG